jgi:cell wall integrity and stress response component
VTFTQTSAASAAPSSGGGSTNTAGIAIGVVVGVVVIMGIVGGIFLVMRRRRNIEIENEHRRNQAVNAFIGGAKPPSSSGGFSMSDQRLDPVMAQRRMSSGSIADNQDYSRRILRV